MPMARVLVLSAVAASIVLVACGGGEEPPGPDPAARAEMAMALFAAPAAQTVALEMTDLKFSTGAIAAKAGEVVELSLANKGGIEHDFSIKTFSGDRGFRIEGQDTVSPRAKGDVHAHLRSKQAGLLRLKAGAPGTYEFYCSVPGHKEAGMKGTLTVQ